MKFKEILGMAGNVLGTVNPLVGGAIKAVNQFLPEEDKLPETASVNQVKDAVYKLSPAEQSAVMEKEIDLEIAKVESFADVQKALAEADAKGASTRPHIAVLMGWAITLCVTPLAWALVYAIIASDEQMINSINDSYMIVLALLAPMVTIVHTYFGKRTKEKEARYKVAANQPVEKESGLATLISAIAKR